MKKINIKFIISELLATITFLGLLWILLSWTDIIFHNISDGVFHSWNFFTILF